MALRSCHIFAGSGIPQVKAAFWRDFGFVRARAIGAKFLAGVFGLGYDDLNAMLKGQVPLGATLLLSSAKLAATIAAFAWGVAAAFFPLPFSLAQAPGCLSPTLLAWSFRLLPLTELR